MLDLKEVTQHMANRDFIGSCPPSDERWRQVYMALADDVPGLAAEVERLRGNVQYQQTQLELHKKLLADTNLQIRELKRELMIKTCSPTCLSMSEDINEHSLGCEWRTKLGQIQNVTESPTSEDRESVGR